MIEARHLSYRVASRALVDGVTFRAAPGEVVVLLGPNGAGKSTLLRLLSGELAPSAGDVYLGGDRLPGLAPRTRATRLGVLPQHSELAFPFSCYEVVLLGRTPHVAHVETPHDHAIARLAMAATDTQRHEDRPYTTLSGGERQRVQASRVLAQIWEGPDARALLLDEPTSSLDLVHQHTTLRLARRMAEDGCAVVCVLHDLNLAAQYADRLVVLRAGRIVAEGPPAEVLRVELLADVFDVDGLVVRHPELDCPLVIPRGPLDRTSERSRPAAATKEGVS